MINDGANKGAWRRQLRDRLGKWVEMYGPVKFDIQIPGVKNKSIGYGIFIGSDRYGWSKIQVEDNKYIPKGVYEIENKYITGVKAIIGLDVSKPKTTAQPKAKPLLKEITGEQALVAIKKSIAKYTKSQGRFPIARNQNDVTQAAKIQYQSIFPQMKAEYPDLMKDYNDPDSFWEGIIGLAVGSMQQWASSVEQINPMTKALNKIYAREILKLDPENGLLTYYRNAVNHSNSKEKSAAGYASLDSKMAWDYNSNPKNYQNTLTPSDGRYTIKVKPDEVLGLIGFSRLQDEYAVVIGPDVTAIPGRIERVGDLEIQKPTPWIDDTETFDRSGGSSPWRQFSTLSNFDYYPLESDPLPGKSFSDFRTGLGLPDDAISKKYQELYGKDVNEALDKAGIKGGLYQGLQSMFIKFKGQDGKDYWGFDPRALDQKYRYRVGGSNEVAEGDAYDVAIKVLSTIQELIGKPFMVNRGHDISDSRMAETTSVIPAIEPSVEEKDSTNGGRSAEEQSIMENRALNAYMAGGYRDINLHLRGQEALRSVESFERTYNTTPEQAAKDLASLINKSPNSLDQNETFYRGVGGIYAEQLLGLQIGDQYVENGFTSITSEPEIAKRFMERYRYASIVIQNSNAKFVYGTVQEKERILTSGSKFEVIKIDQDERKVYVKVVND